MLLNRLICRLVGHRFSSDCTADERGVRTCGRCRLSRGMPANPIKEDSIARALAHLGAAARHDATARRAAAGQDQIKHRLLAEAEREVSRRVMREAPRRQTARGPDQAS